jgi:3-oxoacyl-[acyl-carrier protein] reductase
MDLGITGRVALVTASSRGLGKAAALALAREGARVCMCARTADQLAAAAEEIRAETGASVIEVTADVTSRTDLDALFELIHSEFGGVDILVTNTGGPKIGTFDQLDDTDWIDAFQLVHQSATRMVRHALPHMRSQAWGRIIAIQSSSVKQPVEMLTLSNGLRPGIAGLMKSLIHEVSTSNITVNTVLPGVIMTDRIENAQRARAKQHGRSYEEQLEVFVQRIPMRRFGLPADIGHVVAFLASEGAGYITGGVFQVDGGLIQSVV